MAIRNPSTESLGPMIWTPVLILSQALAASPVSEPGERLIIVGRDGGEFDACGASGKATGLKPGGDGFLSVRIAPSSSAREKDRVGNGQMVSLCDEAGEWIGVVYSRRGDGEPDCGVGTPSAYLGAYRGPCRFGWVHSRYVELLAG